MKSSPRIYLFHGSDSLASFKNLRKWIQLFMEKHPDGRVGILEVDELELNDLVGRISENIEVNTLFPSPKLLVIKRFLSRDKGKSLVYSKKLVEVLSGYLPGLDDDTTILLWEERNIAVTHHFYKFISGLEASEKAKVYHFSVPDKNGVWRYAQEYLMASGYKMSLECRSWLTEQYGNLEQKQRQEAGLRYGDELKFDQRSWWLKQLLDGSIIYAKNHEILLKELQDLSVEINPQIQIFNVIKEIELRRWGAARALYNKLCEGGEEGELFAYFGALRWFFNNQLKSRGNGRGMAEYGQRLMGEIELISKNGLVPNEILIDLVINCLENYDLSGQEKSLLDMRKVWLSRSGR